MTTFILLLLGALMMLRPDPSGAAVITVETYTDRAAFETRLGQQVHVVDFDDIDTSKKDPIAFLASRYKASQGVVIMGEGSQLVSRDFLSPGEFIPTSVPNEYAPGPSSKKLFQGGNNTDLRFFAGTQGALVAGVGVVFIDADFPFDGPSSLEVFDAFGTSLGTTGTVSGANGSQLFRGLVTVAGGNPVAAIASAHIVSGNGWLGNDNNEGVALDDLDFGTPVAGRSTPCGLTPRNDCLGTIKPKKATFTISDKAKDTSDTLTWKWGSGAATAIADFGDPTVGSTIALCLYANGALAMAATAPAAGLCGAKHCWVSAKNGFVYADKKERSPDGITSVKLVAGADGKAAIKIAGKGPTVPLPTTPLTVPIVVQVVRGDGGPCWSATFSTLAKNFPGGASGKSD